jgi:hypothetical protein
MLLPLLPLLVYFFRLVEKSLLQDSPPRQACRIDILAPLLLFCGASPVPASMSMPSPTTRPCRGMDERYAGGGKLELPPDLPSDQNLPRWS